MRSARLPVNLIGTPINYANRLIGSPITSQSTARAQVAAQELGRGLTTALRPLLLLSKAGPGPSARLCALALRLLPLLEAGGRPDQLAQLLPSLAEAQAAPEVRARCHVIGARCHVIG